jgi:Na+-transporting methylmalonyl-CoA/oxaloacetate decarboxylase gamma subunit
MTTNLLIALKIAAIGMGLVFAAIVLLWWMMNLLTFLTAEKDSAFEPDSAESAPAREDDLKAQAAAIAVAIVLAEQQASIAHPLREPPTAIVSAWQLGMRTRQLYEKRGPIVRKPRKIG